MASIYRRNGIWWIHYRIGSKSVSRSLGTTSHQAALEKKKKLEALDTIGQLDKPSDILLTSFLQSLCEFLLSTRTRKSAKNDISYLRSFFGPCCPAMELGSNVPHKFRHENHKLPRIQDKFKDMHIPARHLEDISTEMINNFIQTRKTSDGIKPKTANRIREVLYHMFSYAREHFGYVCPDRRYKNPAEGVRRTTESAPVITWLNSDQIAEQRNVLRENPVIYALVSVYIYAGLRREEALWLTKEDVDLVRKLIRVQAKTVEGEFWQSKTKVNRVVPISNALYEVLRDYKPKHDRVWFFPSPNGKRWNPDNFSHDLREINKANGLKWACLDFRHTFGSHLAMKGESLYKISKLMGNSPEICRKHYAALIPEEMADVVEFSARHVNTAGDTATRELLEKLLYEMKGQRSLATVKPQLKLVRFDESA